MIFDNSTDANFRAWGSAISAAIASMDWVQTGDTGQVNWTTVTSPAAGSFVYEIWGPNDALQTGSTAYYLKVEYGSSSATPKGPRFRTTIGTSTDGAGTLTGYVGTTFEPAATSYAAGSSLVCYFSGDTDRLGMVINGGMVGLMVERTRNADGTNSAVGLTHVSVGNSGSATNSEQQRSLKFGVGWSNVSANNTYVALVNGQNASGVFDNNIPMSPIFPDIGQYSNPMTTAGFIHTQDAADGSFIQATLYGGTRTYVVPGTLRAPSNPVNCKLCMRYD